MKREIKTQDEFLEHMTAISNFVYDSVEKGNLLKEEAKKYYDLIEQLEEIFNERWVKSSQEMLLNRLRNR